MSDVASPGLPPRLSEIEADIRAVLATVVRNEPHAGGLEIVRELETLLAKVELHRKAERALFEASQHAGTAREQALDRMRGAAPGFDALFFRIHADLCDLQDKLVARFDYEAKRGH